MKKKSKLQNKVEKIESLLDVSKIVKDDANSIKNIKKYYGINYLAYRMFHSEKGFMHFRVTKGNAFNDNDVLYQPNMVSSYIPKNAKVVELGFGQGANICYIAKKHPDSSFVGVDLSSPKVKIGFPKNVKTYKHDYRNLSFIESSSVDVVYGIETIVHCSDKIKVFNEVARILKKDGILIIYDYVLANKIDAYLPYQQTAIKIISNGGAAAVIESAEEWEDYFSKSGLTNIKTTDYHKEILPDLKRLEHKASHIMNYDKRIKWVFKLFSNKFVNNILLGWLGYDAYNENIGYYNEYIYKKL